jgi:hypothetical protein
MGNMMIKHDIFKGVSLFQPNFSKAISVVQRVLDTLGL